MYALYCDKNDKSELWISTLGVISKAYPFVRKFAAKQGVESAANEICKFQGNYYLSSDAGILKAILMKIIILVSGIKRDQRSGIPFTGNEGKGQ